MMAATLIPRSSGPKPDQGAVAFWRAAQALDGGVFSHGFDGDLKAFGLVPDRSEATLERLRQAMGTLHLVLPDPSIPGALRRHPMAERDAAQMQRWENSERAQFWSHPDEPTYAVTVPHDFKHPYGDAQGAVFSFHGLADKADQNNRNRHMSALDAANPSRLDFIPRHDVFTAKGEGFGGKFAFFKSRCVGGRDQETRTARGFSLPMGATTYDITAPGVPFLFLEITYDYVSV